MTSRWAETAEDAAEDARRKAAKEEKKRLKAARLDAEAAQRAATVAAAQRAHANHETDDDLDGDRPAKRRRVSTSPSQSREPLDDQRESHLLRFPTQTWQPCRSIDRFESLNHIEEGSYGYVSRAKEEATGSIVAIKKLKLDPARDGGFAVTALREIQCLQAARGHRHVVDLREVVTSSSSEDGGSGSGLKVYLVMEFVEHDLKTLQEEMEAPFSPSEVKTLLLQLGSAVEFLHDHWILHRDLKTSNILMNNRGEIKVADFGMARFCGDPPPSNLTQLVVTLWYRAPELLLGTKTYGKAIDCWSIGCIFGELLSKNALIQGTNEVDQLSKIFELCGIPTETSWPGFKRLPNARSLKLPQNHHNSSRTGSTQSSVLRSKFSGLSNAGVSLMDSLLSLNPATRMSAKELLDHAYFRENPRPKATAMFPTFPSKAGQEKRRRRASPNAPIRGAAPSLQSDIDLGSIFKDRQVEDKAGGGGGFQLKVV